MSLIPMQPRTRERFRYVAIAGFAIVIVGAMVSDALTACIGLLIGMVGIFVLEG